ncbi:hypothetical protein RISK_005034 [Rhodopirellula islandica]|uniref:Uncharacterized protein n=1 Tax=Rhodopirellula islandica TaxID=595434 RepID=A0A0J1B839_RHOIS|nr:hypothetical protein [Rhodopirellula islandica]KLU02738.1 hypothetical protein RISK_005034 [Rhodopirellula islandica]
MILKVDAFIAENGRCPGFHEFEAFREHGFMLKYDTDYVREQGGISSNDYILGYWVSEWHHCYRSWDKQFYDDHEHLLFGN